MSQRTVAVKAESVSLEQVLARLGDAVAALTEIGQRLDRIERGLAESSDEIRDERRDAEVETVVATICGWVRGGRLDPGDRLDGDEKLARSLRVGKMSVALAKQELRQAGDVYKVPPGTPGWMCAYYVGKRPPWTYT